MSIIYSVIYLPSVRIHEHRINSYMPTVIKYSIYLLHCPRTKPDKDNINTALYLFISVAVHRTKPDKDNINAARCLIISVAVHRTKPDKDNINAARCLIISVAVHRTKPDKDNINAARCLIISVAVHRTKPDKDNINAARCLLYLQYCTPCQIYNYSHLQQQYPMYTCIHVPKEKYISTI